MTRWDWIIGTVWLVVLVAVYGFWAYYLGTPR